jgi:hypothetical protein
LLGRKVLGVKHKNHCNMKRIFFGILAFAISSCGTQVTEETDRFYVVESLNTGFITQIMYDSTTTFDFYKVGDTVVVNTYYDYVNNFGGDSRIIGRNSDKMIPKGKDEITFSDSTYYDAYERYVIVQRR